MKSSYLFQAISLCFAIASSGVATAGGGNHDHAPKRGGVVVGGKDMDYEIVAKPETIQIYLSQHGKSVKLEGAKAKVTLLNGSEKTEVEMIPVGDKLEAKGSFKVSKGTKGIALVTLAGKPASTARFEVK